MLRGWIRAKTEAEAKTLLSDSFGDWQLRRVLAVLLWFDTTRSFGFAALRGLSKSEVISILVETWAKDNRPLSNWKIRELLDADQVRNVKDESEKTSKNMRDVPRAVRRTLRRTRAGLLRQRARGAARRVEDSSVKDDIFRVLLSMNLSEPRDTCCYCGVTLSWTSWYERSGGSRRLDPHTVSIDAVQPRSLGGRCTEENVAFCCLACDLLKGSHSVSQLRLFLHLVKTSEPWRRRPYRESGTATGNCVAC